jgi:hypothetical protein
MNKKTTALFLIILLFSGCGLNPQNADLDLNESLPEAKDTIFSKAIGSLGMMSQIYTDKKLKIMPQAIADVTGSSVATNAEIPRDVTEMVKSTLNSVGGNVMFIPYDPQFMQNTAVTGYSDYAEKILPEVVISGGITEFDRALVSKGDSADVDLEIGKMGGINFNDTNKSSLASVTLDFNLIDFKTFAGIPRIQAINSVKLTKSTKEDSFGFTIKSATFGAKGDIKKVQGRHAAVRLIVQLSMIEIIGRYQKLPYWKLIPGASKDEIVIDGVLADFYAMTNTQQLSKAQEFLYLSGYLSEINGQLDSATQTALQKFSTDKKLSSSTLNQEMYLALFENIPIDHATVQKRKMLKNTLAIPTQSPPQIQQASRPAVSMSEVTETKETGSITLSTDKSQYRIGEQLNVNFSVDQPLYVRMVVINSKGEISTLFPNPYQSDNYCKPNRAYKIPSAGAGFTLDISAPTGTDKIRAIASKKPIPSDALHFTTDGNFDEVKMAKYKIRNAANYTITN